MHTGPQSPYTQPQPPHRAGSGALLIGGIAFALVFLLIVAGTVGYLVLRGTGGGRGDTASSTAATTTDGGEGTGPETSTEPGGEGTGPETSTEPGGEVTATATESVTPERCWSPDAERTSTNPSGRLRGGGLEFIPPAPFTERWSGTNTSYFNDFQVAAANVEGTWYSTLQVGKVEWQPGIEYPGDKVAAETIVDCLFRSNSWGKATGRTLDDEFTQAVTVAGMPGYRTDAVVNFAEDDLELTDATGFSVIVVTTPEGPSAFIAEWAVGVTEHEEAAEEAIASLTGLSG